jgi:catechol 2,3-dioxygenase-like lactoylglutathione lyase family enzyme
MSVTTVLAVVCVSDIAESRSWYEVMFGRPPDLTPMESLAEWQITDAGWLQVFQDAERAGSSFLTLAVDDLDHEIATLGARGLPLEEIDADAPMRLARIKDPDGNLVTFGQHLKGHG